jgi:hypothetical protein
MKSFRIFIGVVLMALSSMAFALNSNSVGQAGFDRLSESQKADIIKQVADQASGTSAQGKIPTPEKVGQWLDLGPKIGQMIGGAAREVGLAVNDFVKTPVGQLTMVLIVWHFIGSSIIHILGAFVVLIVGTWAVRRYFSVERRIEYDTDKVDIFKRSRIASINYESVSSEMFFSKIVAQAAIIAAFVIILLTGL